MMQWILLFVAMIFYIISCYLSYQEWFRQSVHYYWVSLLLGMVISLIWYGMVRHLNDKDAIYLYAIVWDISLVMVYFILPLLLFDIKLTRFGLTGVGLIFLGMILLKVK